MSETAPTKDKIIKLPIVQIFEDGSLFSEFICGNDIVEAVSKINSTLHSLLSINNVTTETDPGINNIYSDSMMTDIIESSRGGEKSIIKIYRDGCRKCLAMEPEFIKLSLLYNSAFTWYQAKAEDVPDYIKSVKTRLLGFAPRKDIEDPEAKVESCSFCNGSGSIMCTNCNGAGFTMQGQYGVTCSSCGGTKFLRCTSCGGKCLKCQ